MIDPLLLIAGLVLSVALAVIAKRLEVPFPIVFILAGTALAFVPGLPPVHVSPDWIFLAVLPPLLFAGGWTTDWAIFRANLRPILQLAIGLVIVTTVVVAFIANRIVPGLGFAPALALGAIISPTDAIAAGATFTRFMLPRRIVGIVEGEGMVNDAMALVIYGYAVAASASVTFSVLRAGESFLFVATGGVVFGLLVAWFVEFISRKLSDFELSDSLIDNLLLLGAPYLAYVGGQALHVSGVLAVVTAGITLSRRSSVVYSPQVRLIAYNVWSLWIFLLNAYMFLLIGLQLRSFMSGAPHFLRILPAALAIALAAVIVRLLWVYPTAWLARLIPIVKRTDPIPPLSVLTVIGWTGMRGIVSLAAALALPNGFPHRDVIVFITFVVIFITLVGQGLTLDPLLNWLHIREEHDEGTREIELRIRALEAGLQRIAEIDADTEDAHVRGDLARLHSEYISRVEHLRNQEAMESDAPLPVPNQEHLDYAEREALNAERRTIRALRDRGEIPDEAFRRIEYDLDLAESRLKLER